MKRIRSNQNKNLINNLGYSLVEMIIVIAIIGILAGASTAMIGFIFSANTKKAVETVSSAIEKSDRCNEQGTDEAIYIYRFGNAYYMKVTADPIPVLDTSGDKILAGNTTIYGVSDSGNITLDDAGTSFIKIKYTKSGIFSTHTNVNSIVVDGTRDYTITLAKQTGKHVVE